MFCDVITLVKKVKSVSESGFKTSTQSRQDVFCDVRSVRQSEFYQAQASGFNPEIVFVLADYFDYDNQKEVEYNGRVYSVIRTYIKDNTIEITCTGGVNNASS